MSELWKDQSYQQLIVKEATIATPDFHVLTETLQLQALVFKGDLFVYLGWGVSECVIQELYMFLTDREKASHGRERLINLK